MSNKAKYPPKYKHLEVESKWVSFWESHNVYKWNENESRENTYVVDTPPPTVSGSLHVGHAFSYTQTDVIVRYQRMLGKNIYYPMGWDDNGLPTERRVQNYLNIQCDPSVKYDPNYKPEKHKKSTPLKVSRPNFIEACNIVTEMDEKLFENVWKKLGLSVDWSLLYTTISDHARRISQYSFIDLIKKGYIYNTEAITMWDVDFKTAVAQAEIEDRQTPGAYHDIAFGLEDGEEFIISTTRPELLPACIAVAAHPDDERYKKYFGKKAITPLFKSTIPIVASEHADPEKGSGILMVCTFGDIADVEWWKKSGLPAKQIIGLDGKLMDISFGNGNFNTLDVGIAQKNYDQIKGLPVKKAQKIMVELLSEEGSSVNGKSRALKGDPISITHPVRYYEKGERPLEFIPTRQWFIRILDIKNELLNVGRKINWYPNFMRARYEHWVEGLNQDWCISRQRYFGVPLPVWYPVLKNGLPDYDKPIFPEESSLPIDPLTDVPHGYKDSDRNIVGGFTGESDIMDTWGTSSLTPQISSHWGINEKRHNSLFPADLRPQAHDIIRTWTFYTITKAYLHEKKIPWKHIAISGFIVDPDRKKMSKSKGNTITPEKLLDEQSSDVFRYWASRGRLGVDSIFDETGFKMGRKLVTKLFNASKFVFMQLDDEVFDLSHVSTEMDRGWISIMRRTIRDCSKHLDNLDYSSALHVVENSFWNFCDNYLEMVKVLAYQGGERAERKSSLATLNWTINSFLRLFAPFVPFVTEEIYSFRNSGSVHKAKWPDCLEIKMISEPIFDTSYAYAVEIIGKIRTVKTNKKASLKTKLSRLEIKGPGEDLEALKSVIEYVCDAGNVEKSMIVLTKSDEKCEDGVFEVKVELLDV